MKLSPLIFLPVLLLTPSFALAEANHTSVEIVRCSMSSTAACPGGVCIADKVTSKISITFDLPNQRYSSAWGKGRITQIWDLPDGSHGLTVSLPPAGAEMIFSPGWKTAAVRTGDSSISYTCEVIS